MSTPYRRRNSYLSHIIFGHPRADKKDRLKTNDDHTSVTRGGVISVIGYTRHIFWGCLNRPENFK